MEEFLKEFGEYAEANGEEWRLDRPELMDAYQAACEQYKQQYLIGPLTLEQVFRKNGMTNMHDLQAVLNAVEQALANPVQDTAAVRERVAAALDDWTIDNGTSQAFNRCVDDVVDAVCAAQPKQPVEHNELVERLLDIGSMHDDQHVARTAYDAVDALSAQGQDVEGWAFAKGDFVRKKSGTWWEGRVVGTYTTDQNPRGYAVQLDRPFGPVQIYPESALEAVTAPAEQVPQQPTEHADDVDQFGLFQLWFFQHLKDEQRTALFKLNGYPTTGMDTHGMQRRALKHWFAQLTKQEGAPGGLQS